MRVPLPWLGEYVDLSPGTTGAEVAAALVRVGLEEEALHGGDVVGPLVVGRVLDFVEEAQKNGKTIRWCQVDVGGHNLDGAPRGIVCGARNFAVGDLVVVVLPGAVLPGPFAITARKTYGHVSDGMICSARELGLGDDHDGIIRLVTLGLGEAVVGSDAIALLGLADETVEINVTPDRGYAFSVRGVARDYAASTGAAFHDPADLAVPAPTADGHPVRIADEAPLNAVPGCDRYVARVVRGVDPAAVTPRWMQRRLEQAGMRPISLAVDVTNYVMLGLGQPLHAFDLDRLQGEIVVRRARPGETLTTLDDVERSLDPQDLLITDAGGERVLALAGVMGGASSEVHEGTTDLLIEAAHFEPITVARTARRHKLVTEAGKRFERGVDDDLAGRAAELVVRLLVEHGGGRADGARVEAGPVTDVDERRPVQPVTLPLDLPSRVVGLDYGPEQVRSCLLTIGCEVVDGPPGSAAVVVRPPSWRPDLRLPVDLVEEVARLVGYDAIPSVLPTAPPGLGLTPAQRRRRSVARALAEHGLVEVLTYPFVSAEIADTFGLPADDARRVAVRLANPLSDEQPLLRTNLLSTLLEALRRNVSRGATDVAVFEIGLVTRPGGSQVAPRLPVGQVPSDAELAELYAAVPSQPRRVAMAFTGNRVPAGWAGPARAADWTDAVDAAQHVAATLGLRLQVSADDHAPWHPGRCARLELDSVLVGHAGELHPTVLAGLGLPARTCAAELDLDLLLAAADRVRQAAPVSTFPLAKEDVALVVDTAVPAAAVEAALRAGGGELVESVRLFDVYSGPQLAEGKKSLAFALRLRAADRTLTAAETAAVREAAVREAAERVGASLRG